MPANASALKIPYAKLELVPFAGDALRSVEEPASVPASRAESARFAKGAFKAIDFEVTAIDFEVEAARCLYGSWQAQRQGDVFLIRTLDRISEHLKALQAIQASLS
jgi:hypothetical protein